MTRQTPVRILTLVVLVVIILLAPSAAAQSPAQHSISVRPSTSSINPVFLPVVTYAAGNGVFGASSAIRVADVNGDGKPDVVIADASTVSVLLGNGDGTFQPVLIYSAGGSYCTSITVADFNGDGKPDLAISCGYGGTNNSTSVGVLLNNGDGTFQTAVVYATGYTILYGTATLAAADLNGDGNPDLVVVSGCSGGSFCSGDGVVSVLLGKGDGTFRTPVLYDSGAANPLSVTIADLDGDGKQDILVENVGPLSNSDGALAVFLGQGDGTFSPAVVYDTGCTEPTAIAVTDLNNDGKPDIVTSCISWTGTDYGFISVMSNNGDGSFATPAIYYDGLWPSSLVVTDVNGDGKPDIVSANWGSDSVGVLLNKGDGSFSVAYFPSGGGLTGGDVEFLAVADINGDGYPDLLVTNNPMAGYSQSSVGLLLGHGDGTFQPAETFPTNGGVAVVVAADLNSDSNPDAVVLNECGDNSCDSTVGVLMNNTGRPFNPSATTLASSTNPVAPNQQVTYTAAITSQRGGVVTGTVTFTDSGIPSSTVTVPVSSNQAVYATSYKPHGRRTVWAAYSGDADNGFSTSAHLSEWVLTLPTVSSTSLATSGTPSFIGQPVTFTATVSWQGGFVPNGEPVAFYDGASLLGSGTTASGAATFTTSSLAAKTHSIKAIYAGDAAFKPSLGKVTQVVELYPTTTALTSSPNPSVYKQAVTFIATVTSTAHSQPTGKVTFRDGTTIIGSASLSEGVATLTKSTLAMGTHAITATYNGDTQVAKSTSSVLSQVVN